MAGIISTKGIKGAGLKKCIPIIRLDVFNAAPIEAIDNDDVFVAKIQCSDTTSSSDVKTSCLILKKTFYSNGKLLLTGEYVVLEDSELED